MGIFGHFLYPWGLVLQGLAIIHFIRRRPDTYWIYIILFLGPVGALVYLVAEALPDMGQTGQPLKVFQRRRRIGELQAVIRDNPSTGNYEELGDLYLDEGRLQAAHEAYARSIAAGASTTGPFYGRGVCALLLGDAAAALPDLEMAVDKEFGYDFYRAAGLLARAYGETGQRERAEALFRQVTARSTRSETYLDFADLLAQEGKTVEAREWAQRVLDKRPNMPGYLKRRERPWFRRARRILKYVPA